jgi:DNA mismatch repair ATPase MutS
VARLAGVPGPVLDRAAGILAELESRHQLPEAKRRPVVDPPERQRKRKPRGEAGPTLFEGQGTP